MYITMCINRLPLSCSGVSCQMYADDSLIYTSAETASKAANHLTRAVAMCVFIRNKSMNDLFLVNDEQNKMIPPVVVSVLFPRVHYLDSLPFQQKGLTFGTLYPLT